MNEISYIFEEFNKSKLNLEMTISEMKKDINRFINNIVIYGAGSSGIAFLYFLRRQGIEPVGFVDSNPQKIGKICEGLKIYSVEEMNQRNKDESLVIVCINTDGKRYCKSFDEALAKGGHHAVYDRLKSAGYKNIIDYTYFRRCYKLFKDEKYNAPSCSDVNMMELNKKYIIDIYDLLADDLSKEIYEKIVRFRLLDDSIEIPTCSQENQYFEYDLFEKRDDEVVIDCGAYNGISLKTFLKENVDRFTKYYCLEPDELNYMKLLEYIDSLEKDVSDKVTCIKKGVFDRNKSVNFYSLSGPGSFVADIGKEKIETIKIDDLLDGSQATFIKMNIEGSEKQALYGAEKTIKNWKPKLAIAGYHRTEDLWKIPQIITEYRPDYKIYLRSYMNHISFVYYCI